MEKPYLIVNDIWIEQKEVIVGATDNQRWDWDINDGKTGADAKTLVFVRLELTETGYVLEKAGFHCSREDSLRALAMSKVERLLDIAWDIYESKWDNIKARDVYFGHELKD